MTDEWVLMVTTILEMLGKRELTPAQAESWLKALVEFAEVTYV